MDVSVSQFRAELKTWLDRVGAGEEFVITDRGTPVARLVPVTAQGLIDALEYEGLMTPPKAERPIAKDQHRTAPRGLSSNAVSEIMRKLRL